MLRLLSALALAGVVARAPIGLPAPIPTASCTVVQVDETHYQATATWSAFSATGLQFLQGSTVLAQTEFGHPTRKGSFTVTLSSAPGYVQMLGNTTGPKGGCTSGT